MPEVKLGERTVTIQRPSFDKGTRAITLFGEIQKTIPDLTREVGEFRREYAEHNFIVLDRVQARARFGPVPVLDDDGEPVMSDGSIVTMPSLVDRITEQDWERSGNVLRMPEQPTQAETLMAVMPLAFQRAQEPVYRLLALMIMPNVEVSEAAANGDLHQKLDALYLKVIAPAEFEEVQELAVTVAEVFETSVLSKARALGARLGKLRTAVFGETKTPDSTPDPISSETPEPSSTSNATSTPESSDGTPTESSDSHTTSLPTSVPTPSMSA